MTSILSADESRALYFQTAASDNFTKKNNILPSKKMEECRGENCMHIHEMGKKSQKYIEYKPGRAPFWQRQNCKYSEEFIPRPLGDDKINRELAKTFKPIPHGNTPGKISDKTLYRDDFIAYKEKMKFAKSKPFLPENARHEAKGPIESTTTMSRMFENHRGRFCPDSFKPKKQTHSADPRLFTHYDTRYGEVFNKDKGRVGYHREGKPLSSEDNSFRIFGSSVPNKVRDFFNLRRIHSTPEMSLTDPNKKPADPRPLYMQGPSITDLINMSKPEIKVRAENPSNPNSRTQSKSHQDLLK